MLLRHLTASLALVGALSLVGCSGDEPDPGPGTASSSAAASTSPSPTGPVPPVLPELAKRHDEVGAKAFVKYWFAAVTYAMQTGDTGLFMAVSAEECKTCAGLRRAVERIYGEDGHLLGGGWQVESIERDPRLKPPLYRFSVRVIQPSQRVLDREGGTVERTGRREFLFFAGARWDDGFSFFGLERIDD